MSSTPPAPPTLRPLESGEAEACESLLRSLPEWFGIEEAIVSYRRNIEQMDTRVAALDETVVGFLTLRRHGAHSAEIQVMAVAREHHRAGIGTALVRHVEAELSADGVEFFQVKTLAPSHPDPNYAGTRLFYEGLGFQPLEENELWGSANPCLVLIKHLPGQHESRR